MTTARAPTKKMGLRISADIEKTMQAVRDVAQATNVPKVVFPQ